jgi:mediator of RNA polymerase II transcription subunit 31
MASNGDVTDTSMADAQPPMPPDSNGEAQPEPKYAGFTRFEIELEVCLLPTNSPPAFPPPLPFTKIAQLICSPQFVQSLANPFYLNHLASQKLLSNPAFIAYLSYLRYWTRAPYLKYLTYPGPTIKNLELLQQERFRKDIISPELVGRMVEGGIRAAEEWHREE